MTVDVGPAAAAPPGPARARLRGRVALTLALAVLVGGLVVTAMSLVWIGWPDGNGVGFYPDGVSDSALAVDHVLLALATVAVLAVSGVLTVRGWRRLAGPGGGRALPLAVGLLLALPTGFAGGAASGWALTRVETAQATVRPADGAPAADEYPSPGEGASPCGYTWACVARTARSQHVRVLVPPAADGWGILTIRADHPGRVVLILARGPALCLLESASSPVATTPGGRTATVEVRGTAAVLTADGAGLSWAVNWGEAGAYYRVQCPGGTDRASMLGSLTAAG